MLGKTKHTPSQTHTHTRIQKAPEAWDLPSEVTGDFPDKPSPEEGAHERRARRIKKKKKKGQAANLILADRTQSGLPHNYLCLTAFYLSLISVYQPLLFFHSPLRGRPHAISQQLTRRGTASKAREEGIKTGAESCLNNATEEINAEILAVPAAHEAARRRFVVRPENRKN